MRHGLGRLCLGISAGLVALWAGPLAILPATGGGTAHAGAPIVRVAVMAASPPFSHQAPDGTLTGFNVEIMQALCRVMAATCRFEEVPFQDLLEAVASARYDYGLANFLRTPDREAKVVFSAPYWRSSSSVVGAPGEADKAVPQALAGRRVGVIRGSRQHAYVKRIAGTLAGVVEASHLSELWDALRAGRIEFVLVSTLAALGFLVSEEGKAFSTIGTPMMDGGLGGTVHIVMPPGRPELKAAVDEAIAAIRIGGAYQDVNRRYFPFDVY